MTASQPIRTAVLSAALLVGGAAPLLAQVITVDLDAREAPRHVLHSRLVIPAAPGPLTLLYPQWIPGEHRGSGPINGVVGLRFTAGGREIAWRRDAVDMFTFRLEVPPGATAVEVELDYVTPVKSGNFSAGPSMTDRLAVVSWNQVVLYPQGQPSDALTYQASLRLPDGWSFAAALPVEAEDGGGVRFGPVSLTTLVDAPVLAGAHLVKVPLAAPGGVPAHEVDIAADSAAGIALPEGFAAAYARLVAEGAALFGAQHFRHYRWLLTLSDHVRHFGLEHHESSDNRMPEETLAEEGLRRSLASLLAHEYVHSWNGKHRRPAGLATPDYQQPMQGELLWIYEGLTQHLGLLLPARSGLWTPEYYRERVAALAAQLDHTAGRRWRPLADTAVSAPVLFEAPSDWRLARRGRDFYDESVLVWLEADTTIRRATGGRRSLDDFCRRFHGGASGPPAVKPYTLDDIVATLDEVAPHDWRGFFRDRVETITPRAPLGGLEAAGWRLVYTVAPNEYLVDSEKRGDVHYWTFSLGILVDKETRAIEDVVPGSPAAAAGLAPGMKLVAVNGRKWTGEVTVAALREGQGGGTAPIEILAENGEFVRAFRVDYHGGERHPHLERIPDRPDLLSEILAPRAGG
jgi:predicted metalloprotease with PDZ domain